MQETPNARRFAAIIAVLAGCAVAAQFGLNLAKGDRTAAEVLLRLFGYFTIWSNTAVAVVAAHYARHGPVGLSRPAVLASVLVYIIVVGLIYNTLLIGFNHVTGLRLVIDRVLHMAVPLAYPVWWWRFRPAGALQWRDLAVSLPVPFLYCLWSLYRGAATGKYAYFFIDVGKFGWSQVIVNIAGLVLLFMALMAAAIWVDRRRQPVVA
ncbi:Pr6Pr family membrane protein [Sandarakinorhabdus sp.]|uniref:Pr6Pr family membrane protein n=1 Tax=Sandarakinorhabdus sp. TaxID=1916663 RepID=UPI00286DAF0A|nr:Pr6Pr family membrane protein [Sandarakinorhabdus sp.]